MQQLQRKISVVTSFGKKYVGDIDIPSSTIRTTDLLNGASVYWKNSAEKSFENSLLIHNVSIILDETQVYKKNEKMQLRTSEIILFYDHCESIFDDNEKSRAMFMRDKAQEETRSVNIITPTVANSFYDITGKFYGLFKKKSQNKFIPFFDAKIVEIQKYNDKWAKRSINLPFNFAALNINYIESFSFLQ